MQNAHQRWLITSLLIVLTTSSVPSFQAEAASDPRFFGTYCGTHRESATVTLRMWFFGWHTISENTYSIDFSIRAEADYQETTRGNGLVNGKGNAQVTNDTIPDPFSDFVLPRESIPFVFTGLVTERGRLEGSGIAPSRESTRARAALSSNGNAIVAYALDRRITLFKDQCGNAGPSARIVQPTASRFPWGQRITFQGTASDPEDASFPAERLIWTSDRDGRLGTGLTVAPPFRHASFLSPGTHNITFSATDSGGRAALASRRIQITNNPPRVWINEPSSGLTTYAGLPIPFRGHASDREHGNLTGDALVWYDGATRFGSGNLTTHALTPGRHTINLTATDIDGLANTASVSVTVQPRPPGNTPPSVAIVAPADRSGLSDAGDDCFTFVAEAHDLQDGASIVDTLVWEDQQDGAGAPTEIGRGPRIEKCGFSAGAYDTWHTITVRATDSDGSSTTGSIRIYVIPGGLI